MNARSRAQTFFSCKIIKWNNGRTIDNVPLVSRRRWRMAMMKSEHQAKKRVAKKNWCARYCQWLFSFALIFSVSSCTLDAERHGATWTARTTADMNSVHLQVPDIHFNEEPSAWVLARLPQPRARTEDIPRDIWRWFFPSSRFLVLFSPQTDTHYSCNKCRWVYRDHSHSITCRMNFGRKINSKSVRDKSDQQRYQCDSVSKDMLQQQSRSDVMRFVFGSVQFEMRISFFVCREKKTSWSWSIEWEQLR